MKNDIFQKTYLQIIFEASSIQANNKLEALSISIESQDEALDDLISRKGIGGSGPLKEALNKVLKKLEKVLSKKKTEDQKNQQQVDSITKNNSDTTINKNSDTKDITFTINNENN